MPAEYIVSPFDFVRVERHWVAAGFDD